MSNSFIDIVHDQYYISQAWMRNTYHGIPILKFPADTFAYQEIIWETRPTLIIECGTAFGASGLLLADTLEAVGVPGAKVISIDLYDRRSRYARHDRLIHRLGRSSVDPEVVAEVTAMARGQRVMVILDSDHSQKHVAAEIEAYAHLVTPGCYLIVEDTNINGHPTFNDFGPGPWEAVSDFLDGDGGDIFTPDYSHERNVLTANPRGYLKRDQEKWPIVIGYSGEIIEEVRQAVWEYSPLWVLMDDDEAYWRLLRSAWNQGQEFFVLEHDVIPPAGAFESMKNCPELWCGVPYMVAGEVQPSLGCTRFSERMVKDEHPHLLNAIGNQERHWSVQDAYIKTVLKAEGIFQHVHNELGPAAHLNESASVAPTSQVREELQYILTQRAAVARIRSAMKLQQE